MWLSGKSLKHIVIMLLPLQGAAAPTRDTQGVATLALGYVLHWAFSPYLHIHFYYTQALMVQPPRCCFQPVLAHTLLLYRN